MNHTPHHPSRNASLGFGQITHVIVLSMTVLMLLAAPASLGALDKVAGADTMVVHADADAAFLAAHQPEGATVGGSSAAGVIIAILVIAALVLVVILLAREV